MRNLTLLVVGVLGLGIYFFSDRLSTLSDALWWQILPWVLLVVLWVVLGPMLWRSLKDMFSPGSRA